MHNIAIYLWLAQETPFCFQTDKYILFFILFLFAACFITYCNTTCLERSLYTCTVFTFLPYSTLSFVALRLLFDYPNLVRNCSYLKKKKRVELF